MVVATSRRSSTPAKGSSKTRARHAREVRETVWGRHQRDIWIVLMILAGLLILLAEIDALGPVGHALSTGLKLAFGVGRIAIPALLIGLGVILVMGSVDVERARFIWGISLALVSISGLGDVAGGRPGLHASAVGLGRAGGWLGVVTGGALSHLIGEGGTVAALLALLIIALMIGTSVGLSTLVRTTVAILKYL